MRTFFLSVAFLLPFVIVKLPHVSFSHKLGIFFASASANALDNLNNKMTDGDNLDLLAKYSYLVTSGVNHYDSWVQWKFLSGGGACNHLADVYTYLLEYPPSVKAKSFALEWLDGKSYHTIPIFFPRGGKGSFIYDPYYGNAFKNKRNELIPVSKLCKMKYEDLEGLSDDGKAYLNEVFKPFSKDAWEREGGLEMLCKRKLLRGVNQTFEERGTLSRLSIRLFTNLPVGLVKWYFFINASVEILLNKLSPFEMTNSLVHSMEKFHGEISILDLLTFTKARLNHIFLNLNDAKDGYRRVITTTQNKSLANGSRELLKKIDTLKNFKVKKD